MLYKVYFTIKRDRQEFYHFLEVKAKTQKEAIQIVRQHVQKKYGRNAFTPFTAPMTPKDYQRKIMAMAERF